MPNSALIVTSRVAGVTPIDPIGQLRQWVEKGEPPKTLKAGSEYPVNASTSYAANGTNVRYLDLCPYPQVQKYSGGGADPASASSWNCVADSDGWLDFESPGKGYKFCVGGPGWYG